MLGNAMHSPVDIDFRAALVPHEHLWRLHGGTNDTC